MFKEILGMPIHPSLGNIKILTSGIGARLSISGLTALKDDVNKGEGISRTFTFR
jgi:hypothetical protein